MTEQRDVVASAGGTAVTTIYQIRKGGLRTVLFGSVCAAYPRTRTLQGG